MLAFRSTVIFREQETILQTKIVYILIDWQKKVTIQNAVKDVKKWDHSYIAGEKAK